MTLSTGQPINVNYLFEDDFNGSGEFFGRPDSLDDVTPQVAEQQVGAWLKSGKQVKEEDFAARQPTLEEAAKKIVGEVAPMAVLNHWMEHELATLLSNPQLAGAVDDLLAAKANANAAEH